MDIPIPHSVAWLGIGLSVTEITVMYFFYAAIPCN